jgi:AAA domain
MITTLTIQDKENIAALIEQNKRSLGSYDKVANKCDVSVAAIVQLKDGNYNVKGNGMWLRVGAALGFRRNNEWTLANIRNTRDVQTVLQDAKNGSLWFPISDNAGSGKTEACKSFYTANRDNHVFYIECRNWGTRAFINKLCKNLGIAVKGTESVDDCLESVIEFFQARRYSRPLLIIDQANSLRPSVIPRISIPLYNETQGGLGVVVLGTDALKKIITNGVKYDKDGFDETESRFERKYIGLLGCQLADIEKICSVNGIPDAKKAAAIFEECEPVREKISEKHYVRVVKDLRRVRRIIERENRRA